MKGHSKRSLKVALSPAKTTWPQHSVCTCQSFHMLNSQSRIVEGQACQRGDVLYDLGTFFGLQVPSRMQITWIRVTSGRCFFSLRNLGIQPWDWITRKDIHAVWLFDNAEMKPQVCQSLSVTCGDLVDLVWNISKPFSLAMLFMDPPCDCCGQSQ